VGIGILLPYIGKKKEGGCRTFNEEEEESHNQRRHEKRLEVPLHRAGKGMTTAEEKSSTCVKKRRGASCNRMPAPVGNKRCKDLEGGKEN